MTTELVNLEPNAWHPQPWPKHRKNTASFKAQPVRTKGRQIENHTNSTQKIAGKVY